LKLYTLVYVSAAREPFSKGELVQLLDTCRKNNTGSNISGMLLYKEKQFIQVLEGNQKDVVELHKRIAEDYRHQYVTTIYSAEIEERSFSDWSMGFKNLDLLETEEIDGYSDFLNTSLASDKFATDAGSAFRLLNMFKANKG